MKVTTLKLANVRAIREAEFTFQPGFNLIVGVNGVGKTTALEAVSRALAQAIAKCSGISVSEPPLVIRDIRQGAIAARAVLGIDFAGQAVQVEDQRTRNDTATSRPGDLASKVDVHAYGLRRKGRLRRAQRAAQETNLVDSWPKFLPNEKVFRAAAQAEKGHVLAVYFSTVRAMPSGQTVRKQRAVRPPAAAYVDAFTGRELRLAEFADWIDVLQTTAAERADATPMLASLNAAVHRFLPNFIRIRTGGNEPKQLLIDQSDRETVTADQLSLPDRQRLLRVLQAVTQHMSVNWPPPADPRLPAPKPLSPRELSRQAMQERVRIAREQLSRYMDDFENLEGPLDQLPDNISDKQLSEKLGKAFRLVRLPRSLEVAQLSDGERSVLALVLDLTRRLVQANPGVADPAANAGAVVLIDELELHLHPMWQRSIVGILTQTFPKCQFIATTHSPQVIGAVQHSGVTLLVDDGPPIRPSQTFGMDSNWILRHIMEADDRNPEVRQALDSIIKLIRDGDIAKSRAQIAKLRRAIGESPDLAAADAMASRAELLSEVAAVPRASLKRKKRKGAT